MAGGPARPGSPQASQGWPVDAPRPAGLLSSGLSGAPAQHLSASTHRSSGKPDRLRTSMGLTGATGALQNVKYICLRFELGSQEGDPRKRMTKHSPKTLPAAKLNLVFQFAYKILTLVIRCCFIESSCGMALVTTRVILGFFGAKCAYVHKMFLNHVGGVTKVTIQSLT
jgi:hypothetical protein